MQVFLEPDESRVLPIPYWTDGERKRRFWNLKKTPALVNRITELKGCPELREFVLHVNSPASRLATLGCDHWTKRADRDDGLTHEAGLYVDLVFDRFETAARRRNTIDFFERLHRRGARRSDARKGSGLTIVRLQPQRVSFTGLGKEPAWMISAWIFGAGPSKAIAAAHRRHGLDEVRAVCDLLSRAIEKKLGDRGTPVPPERPRRARARTE